MSSSPCSAGGNLQPLEANHSIDSQEASRRAVALSCSGERAVASSSDGARVYLYDFASSSERFELTREFASSDSELRPSARYGAAVALGGSRLLVGAPGVDLGRGRVYGYEDSSSVERFVVSSQEFGGRFGTALSASSSGDRWAASAPATPSDGGRVRVYAFDQPSAPLLELVAPDGDPSDFGAALALSCDGSHLVVGAPLVSRVYVYKLEPPGVSLLALLEGESRADRFGEALAIGGGATASYIAVGAPGANRVYSFQRTDNPTDGALYRVRAPPLLNENVSDFGSSLAGDDSLATLIVGSRARDSRTVLAYALDTASGEYTLESRYRSDSEQAGYSLAVARSGGALATSVLSSGTLARVNCSLATSSGVCPSC